MRPDREDPSGEEAQQRLTIKMAPLLPDHLRRRRRRWKHEPSPARCRDSSRPGLAAFAAAHEFGYVRAEHWRELITGLLLGIIEALCGAGGQRR